ncbi:hypothetical protein [Sorangium sp. So ce131]|uniref:hypothetical protein n=1 Tax=Sorangium sp. So ce131 TaxID=3133282 RepID=UPI003F6165C3
MSNHEDHSSDTVQQLAGELMLGSLLERLASQHGGYDLLDHWQQGEFHHDVVLRVREPGELPGDVLVVATNCNGGVKEVLVFANVPERWALWHDRCPDNPEFEGQVEPILARATTHHWFDPCALLLPDARSELRPEFRARERGGGWSKR